MRGMKGIIPRKKIKFTPEQIKEIRRLWCLPSKSRPSQEALGLQYNCSCSGIYSVVHNLNHYDPEYKPPKHKPRNGVNTRSYITDIKVECPPISPTDPVCPVCGMGAYANDPQEERYGTKFLSQRDANECCSILREG